MAHGGAKLRCTVGDVLLLLLRVYTKEELAKLSPNELSEKLDALWDDVLALQKADPVRVSDKPAEPKQTGLLDRILPGKHTAPSHLKVAFVHERTPGDQLLDEPARVWTYPVGHRICGPGRDDRLLQRSPR